MKGSVSKDANLMTDNARWYRAIMKPYASHEVVNHSKGEYVRGNVRVATVFDGIPGELRSRSARERPVLTSNIVINLLL